MSLVMIINSLTLKKQSIYDSMFHFWGRNICMFAGVKVIVEGSEHMEDDKGYVVTFNHESGFDIIALAGFFPRRWRALAKAELFKIPLFGRAMTSVGMIPVYRKQPIKAKEAASIAINNLQNEHLVYCLAPCGTRSDDHIKDQKWKRGAFIMAIESNTSLVPLVFYGPKQVHVKGLDWIKPGTIHMSILPPISMEGYELSQRNELLKTVQDLTATEYDRLELLYIKINLIYILLSINYC